MGKSIVKCDCNVLHEDVVKIYKKGFSQNKLLIDLSKFFHLLSDNTRIGILSILDGNEVSVSDIASILDMTKSAISHQLKILRDAHFISCQKKGKEIFYTFSNEYVKEIFELAVENLKIYQM